MYPKTFLVALMFALGSSAVSKELSLNEAMQLAKLHNGTVAAAKKNYESAQSAVRGAGAAFFPEIFPEYRYSNNKLNGTGTQEFDQFSIGANWLLLDGGQRQFTLQRSKRLADANKFSTLWTLRQVLFNVTRQYYEVLRARELKKVADSQVVRTNEILEVVKGRVAEGVAARKEILQAEADAANAIVDQITATNQVNTSEAAMKATIGWQSSEPLPDLIPPPQEIGPRRDWTLLQAVETGTQKRPDLEEARQRLKADRFNVLTAKRNASFDWTLNFSYSRNFEPNDTSNRSLTFLLSYPLFDAGRTKEQLNQSKLSYESGELLLEQQVRDARSEIESVFLTWDQNRSRLEASEKALKAAKLNYEAAAGSQAEGVSNILDVTNARVSLVTAETNYVRAIYDYYVADSQLRLVVGEPIEGEQE